MALTRIKGTGITNLAVDTAQLAADAVTSAKIEDLAVDSEHLAALAVETAKINNDAVTGDKIENSPTIASNLTVTGDLSVTGSLPTAAKGWIKLQSTDASDDAFVIIDTGIGSDYDHYMVVGSNIQLVTDGNHLQCELKVDGSYQDDINSYHTRTSSSGSADHTSEAGSQGATIRVLSSAGDATGEQSNFTLYFSNPSDVDNFKTIYWTGVTIQQDGSVRSGFGVAAYLAGYEAMTGIQFLGTSCNVDRGTFTLYGLAK